MSATKETAMLKKLVAMLEERGVEFRDFIDEPDAYVAVGWVVDGRAYKIYRIDISDGTLCIDGLTPEQAIAATLGRGTCHDNGGIDENNQQVFECDACGCMLSLYDRDGVNTMCTHFIFDYPRFCPACGRKVVDA